MCSSDLDKSGSEPDSARAVFIATAAVVARSPSDSLSVRPKDLERALEKNQLAIDDATSASYTHLKR